MDRCLHWLYFLTGLAEIQHPSIAAVYPNNLRAIARASCFGLLPFISDYVLKLNKLLQAPLHVSLIKRAANALTIGRCEELAGNTRTGDVHSPLPTDNTSALLQAIPYSNFSDTSASVATFGIRVRRACPDHCLVAVVVVAYILVTISNSQLPDEIKTSVV